MDPGVALNTGVVLAVLTLGASLMLLLVSGLSYARLRNPKLLLAGGAFLILAIKGALGVYRGVALKETDLFGMGLDAAVLGFLYASVALR